MGCRGRPGPQRFLDSKAWANFLSWRNFRHYTTLIPVAWWHDIFGQTFILKRGFQRWAMHMAIFWGVVLSCLVTFPLTFGWIRFGLVPPENYRLWFFGLPVLTFPIEAGTGFALFHVLDFTALLLIVGLAIAFWRRMTNVAECFPIAINWLWQARDNGARLIVVDPRETPAARTADLWLPLRPARHAVHSLSLRPPAGR